MTTPNLPSDVREIGTGRQADDEADPDAAWRAKLRVGKDLEGCIPEDVSAVLRRMSAKDGEGQAPIVIINRLIGGRLDLHGYPGKVLLRLVGCELDALILTDATLLGLELEQCRIGKLDAFRLSCAGSVKIFGGACAEITLHGASMGGNWYAGTEFPNRKSPRLRVGKVVADGARITGHVVFCGATCDFLELNGTSVGRDLDLRALEMPASDGALSLLGARVGGRLRLGHGKNDGNSLIKPAADLRNMRIEGALQASAAQFDGTLNLESVRAAGSVVFNCARFAGKVSATNMRVDGDLSFDGARFGHRPDAMESEIYRAAGLDMSGSRITGCGFFGVDEETASAMTASAPIRLRATEFGERLVFWRVELYSGKLPGLSMVGCKVGTELHLDCVNAPAVSYDLRDVTCRRLYLGVLPRTGQLTGLHYSMLRVGAAEESDAADAMLRFVKQCHGDTKFSPAPYKALEAYLQGNGSEGLARDVAQERRRRELSADRGRAKSAFARARAWLHTALLWLAGYGYSPNPALLASLGVIFGFALIAQCAPGWVGQFCNGSNACCDNSFVALIGLGLDSFIPFAKLGLSSDLVAVEAGGRWLLAGIRVLGFLLTTLVIGAWSGLMRKS